MYNQTKEIPDAEQITVEIGDVVSTQYAAGTDGIIPYEIVHNKQTPGITRTMLSSVHYQNTPDDKLPVGHILTVKRNTDKLLPLRVYVTTTGQPGTNRHLISVLNILLMSS